MLQPLPDQGGVTTVSKLQDAMAQKECMPRTWNRVYTLGFMQLAQPAGQSKQAPPREASPMFWMEWNTQKKLRYLFSLTPEPPRQGAGVWKAWDKLSIPPKDKLFVQKALWKKLAVGEWLPNWQPRETRCPLDGQLETSEHATCACKYITVAAHIAVQCMAGVDIIVTTLPGWGGGALSREAVMME